MVQSSTQDKEAPDERETKNSPRSLRSPNSSVLRSSARFARRFFFSVLAKACSQPTEDAVQLLRYMAATQL